MSVLRYIQAIRPVNLLMTVYIMVSVRYGLFGGHDYAIPAQHISYFVYVFSVLAVMAFGYLVNDYYDVETDKINKPGKNIFADAPPRRIWVSGSITAALGLFPVAALLFLGEWSFFLPFLMNIVALVSLFIYAKDGKATVLWGNLHIAFLAYLLLWAAFWAAGQFLLHNAPAIKLMLNYAVFSFLATLLREIVKDAEDVDGDTRSAIRTLAGRYDVTASRYVAAFLNILLVTTLTLTACKYFDSQEFTRSIAFAVLAAYGIFTLFILWYARDKAGFRRTSQVLKVYMLLGITSMWL